jgi:hypothetical protein
MDEAPPQAAVRARPAFNRRLHQRHRISVPGLVADKLGCYDCIVTDVSDGGALLQGNLSLNIGQEIALGFDALLGILGKVVRIHDGFFGIEFTDGGLNPAR